MLEANNPEKDAIKDCDPFNGYHSPECKAMASENTAKREWLTTEEQCKPETGWHNPRCKENRRLKVWAVCPIATADHMMEQIREVSLTQDVLLGVSSAEPTTGQTSPAQQSHDHGLKDSGRRVQYQTGGQRERARTSRFDLLWAYVVRLVATHFGQGAKKYAARNWEQGLPLDDFIDSALSHIFAFADGDRQEPHLVAAIWNLGCYLWTLREIDEHRLPEALKGDIEARAVKMKGTSDYAS